MLCENFDWQSKVQKWMILVLESNKAHGEKVLEGLYTLQLTECRQILLEHNWDMQGFIYFKAAEYVVRKSTHVKYSVPNHCSLCKHSTLPF